MVDEGTETGLQVTKATELSMDLGKLKEKAWNEAESTLLSWQQRLENFVIQKSEMLETHINDLRMLYGASAMEKPIVVSLHFFPERDREKGEPAKQLVEKGVNPQVGDVLMWVSEATVLPSDTEKDIRERTADTVARVLHEEQHADLQGLDFENLIKEVEVDPEVAPILQRLSLSQEGFIETTNELITSYIDSYSAKLLKRSGDETPKQNGKDGNPPMIFKVDRKDCEEVLEAVVKEDDSNWEGNNGPYSTLRRGWEKRTGLIIGSSSVSTNEESPSNQLSVYEIGRSLDTTMIDEYIVSKKKIDKDFVKRLFRQVGVNFDNQS